MKNPIPFLIFKRNLEDHLIANHIYNRDWFLSQSSRISIWWNAGETMEGAIEMIEIFARGFLDKDYHHVTNPLDPRFNLSEREKCGMTQQ